MWISRPGLLEAYILALSYFVGSFVMAMQWTDHERAENWRGIANRIGEAASTCPRDTIAKEPRKMLQVLGDELQTFFMHNSNRTRRSLLMNYNIECTREERHKRDLLLNKDSFVPVSFYATAETAAMEVVEEEEDKGATEQQGIVFNPRIPERTVSSKFETLQTELQALKEKMLEAVVGVPERERAQLLAELSLSASNSLFEHAGSVHPHTQYVEEGKKAFAYLKSSGTRCGGDQHAHDILAFSLYPPHSNKSLFARSYGINRQDASLF
jgi:hypothetical protein